MAAISFAQIWDQIIRAYNNAGWFLIGLWRQAMDWLTAYGQQMLHDPLKLALGVAVPLAVLTAIVLLILKLRKRRRKRQMAGERKFHRHRKSEEQPRFDDEGNRIFVPVSMSAEGPDTLFMSLEEKMLAADTVLRREVVDKLMQDAPRSLNTITELYPRLKAPVQAQLKVLVQQMNMLEGYAAHLGEEQYSPQLLADAWYHFPNEELLPVFISLLLDKNDAPQQMAGVKFLSEIKEPRTLPHLMAALARPDIYVPSRVAEVLAAMGATAAKMIAYLLPQTAGGHKKKMLEVLAQIDAVYPPQNVLASLRDDDRQVRAAAAEALGAGCVPEAVLPLIDAAADGEWQVRAAAAQALGQIGDARALPVLEHLCGDAAFCVKENARRAIESIEKNA
ncbi:MAG: HEAT repeat domain-containing protein [Bacillota bacterium]|nr:HEAT repeat domain-containing protein [Bacillota bacterium]